MDQAATIQSKLRTEYERDGVAIVRGALGPEEVAFFHTQIDGLLAAHAETKPIGNHAVVVRHEGGAYCECISRKIPAVMDRVLATALPRIAAELMGVEEVTLWRDEVHYKFGGNATNSTPWHHGVGSFPFKGEHAVTVWIPLTRITAEDSPLLTITGSHRDQSVRFRPPTRDKDQPPLPGYADPPDFDAMIADGEVEVVAWTAEPGDAVIFHPYTVHGAPPNAGARPRMAYVSRWLGSKVAWQPDAYSVLDAGVEDDLLVNGIPQGRWFPRVATREPAI
jgi:ectoine hydroxylase-related dioxygenase (phytanoyl-CoA dioxygenase family)